MSADIERIDGVLQFAWAMDGGKPWWHRIGDAGIPMPGASFTIDDLRAKLPTLMSDHSKVPTFYQVGQESAGDVSANPWPGTYAIVRDLDGKPLTRNGRAVGERFEIIQPREIVSDLIEAAHGVDAEIETAGLLADGTRGVFLIRRPDEGWTLTRPDGTEDRHDSYALVTCAFDGSGTLEYMGTSVRVVCSNTERWAIHAAKAAGKRHKVRHTTNWRDRVRDLREGIKLARVEAEQMADAARGLDARPFSRREAAELFAELLEVNDEKASEATRKRRTSRGIDLLELFENGKGNLGRTRYDAFNAVTEYYDHHVTVRGADDENTRRVQNAITGQFDFVKARALALLQREAVAA